MIFPISRKYFLIFEQNKKVFTRKTKLKKQNLTVNFKDDLKKFKKKKLLTR